MNRTTKTTTFLLLFAFIGWLSNSDRAVAQQPTKEALIETLNTVYPLLESQEYDKAIEHFALPEKFLAEKETVHRELARMIEIQEISPAGIERLKQAGSFGTAIEIFGDERAKLFADKMEADPQKCWGLKLLSAEVMAIWNDGKFKLVRLDDVGKLKAADASPAKKADPVELFKEGLALEEQGSFSKAWPRYADAHKLGHKSKQLKDAINRCMNQFSIVGIFEVGITQDHLVKLLGEPHEKIKLGKDRQRWLYGSWGIDFRSSTLHEIIDLRGATNELFLPTETVTLELDGRGWTTQFREKRKGHVVAYLYPEKYTRDWTNQITVERMLYQDSVSAEDFAQEQIDRATKRNPNSKHKVLAKQSDTSIIFAAEIPLRQDGTALHKLCRVLKGPKDIHQITYTIRSKEAPTMETQMKWLEIFKSAKLDPVKR